MGLFSDLWEKAKAFVMKPINAAIDALKEELQLNKIQAFFVAILCFAEYLRAIFKWTFETIETITKYALAAPLCFIFWVLNSFVMFMQYVILDILLELVLSPSRIVGKTLGHPGTYTYDKKTKAWLYEKTNFFQAILGAIDNNLKLNPKIQKTCFNIGTIKSFPVL